MIFNLMRDFKAGPKKLIGLAKSERDNGYGSISYRVILIIAANRRAIFLKLRYIRLYQMQAATLQMINSHQFFLQLKIKHAKAVISSERLREFNHKTVVGPM